MLRKSERSKVWSRRSSPCGSPCPADLLNDRDSKSEPKFRLGTRVARLVEQDLADRREIAENVRDLYSVRSRLAEGRLGA